MQEGRLGCKRESWVARGKIRLQEGRLGCKRESWVARGKIRLQEGRKIPFYPISGPHDPVVDLPSLWKVYRVYTRVRRFFFLSPKMDSQKYGFCGHFIALGQGISTLSNFDVRLFEKYKSQIFFFFEILWPRV